MISKYKIYLLIVSSCLTSSQISVQKISAVLSKKAFAVFTCPYIMLKMVKHTLKIFRCKQRKSLNVWPFFNIIHQRIVVYEKQKRQGKKRQFLKERILNSLRKIKNCLSQLHPLLSKNDYCTTTPTFIHLIMK